MLTLLGSGLGLLLGGVLAVAAVALLLRFTSWLFSNIRELLTVALVMAGAILAVKLPDLDLAAGQHRSALTHSALAPAVLYALGFRRLAWALALGFGVHLVSDLNPKQWVGFANIKVPFAGSLPGPLSFLWIAANAVLCAAMASACRRETLEHAATALIAFGLAAGGAWFYFMIDMKGRGLGQYFVMAGWLGAAMVGAAMARARV